MAFDLQVFNKQTYTAMTETIDQHIDAFNQASGGAIQLINRPFEGDFDIRTQFQSIAGLVRRRNAYGDGAVEASTLKQMLEVAVKVAAGTPPIEYEKQQYLWTQQNPELAALVLGEQLAKGRLADMLNAGILAGVAALKGNEDVITDLSSEKASFRGLNRGAGKFGDRANAIRAWVTHSGVMNALFDNALTNGENLFTYDSVNVIRDPFGRLFVVTDSPSLIDGKAFHALGLVENGLVITGNDDFNAELVPQTGNENLKYVYQAEWSFGVAVNGYSWDTTKGKSPTDAQLGASENWLKIATSNKDTAGVLVTMGDIDAGGAGVGSEGGMIG